MTLMLEFNRRDRETEGWENTKCFVFRGGFFKKFFKALYVYHIVCMYYEIGGPFLEEKYFASSIFMRDFSCLLK